MGTLTANVPLLATHCPHKLPTSCRLTSTMSCCACADKRAHSPSYSIYVDGVGFVQRGTRWQLYCWCCKTFWDNRVTAAGCPVAQSHIPDCPDQTAFLDRWYEFHRGYRLFTNDAGEQRRISVMGEPFEDVSPGHLPRTLDELRVGRLSGTEVATSQVQWSSTPQTDDPGQSIEDTLDLLLQDAEETTSADTVPAGDLAHSNSVVTASIDGLAADVTTGLGPPLSGHVGSMTPREAAIARLARVWGSREEIQSPDYVSPVAGMFNRAWGRYRNLEELRLAQETSDLDRMEVALRNIERDPSTAWYATPQAQAALADSLGIRGDGTASPDNTEARLSAMERAVGILAQMRGRIQHLDGIRHAATHVDPSSRDGERRYLGLDGDDRPPPLGEEELKVKLECKVCLSQLANIACLPCGHLGLCTWCADQILPVYENDKTRLKDKNAKCPLCRKKTKRRVQIYTP